MNASSQLTAEQFADRKYDFPDGGRWTELAAGEVVTLSPPDDLHGNVVLNFTKALAEHVQKTQDGYACFELGLIVLRNPDTVYCPPICYFQSGERFAELENLVTQEVPALVVEIASTNDRRLQMADRINAYLRLGVAQVWLADTDCREMHVIENGKSPQHLRGNQTLLGGDLLREFRTPVEELFAAPKWY